AAGEEHVGETLLMHEAADVTDLWPAADDDEPRLRIFGLETRVRAREVHGALARLDASDEEDVHLAVAELGERLRVRVEVDVDPVRDDPVLAREVARNEGPRRARTRDALVELGHVVIEDHASEPVRDREAAERVERRDVGALRRIEDLEREERHERLVVVDDVELLALEHARN